MKLYLWQEVMLSGVKTQKDSVILMQLEYGTGTAVSSVTLRTRTEYHIISGLTPVTSIENGAFHDMMRYVALLLIFRCPTDGSKPVNVFQYYSNTDQNLTFCIHKLYTQNIL